jgi:hypothetical protein
MMRGLVNNQPFVFYAVVKGFNNDIFMVPADEDVNPVNHGHRQEVDSLLV